MRVILILATIFALSVGGPERAHASTTACGTVDAKIRLLQLRIRASDSRYVTRKLERQLHKLREKRHRKCRRATTRRTQLARSAALISVSLPARAAIM